MEIDLRNLDLVKDLLTIINDELNQRPFYYKDLRKKLLSKMEEYKESEEE